MSKHNIHYGTIVGNFIVLQSTQENLMLASLFLKQLRLTLARECRFLVNTRFWYKECNRSASVCSLRHHQVCLWICTTVKDLENNDVF